MIYLKITNYYNFDETICFHLCFVFSSAAISFGYVRLLQLGIGERLIFTR